jgi:hypothetical protein
MHELTQLSNSRSEDTQLCKDCEYCVLLFGNLECEWDEFEPTSEAKANLFTSVDFDCLKFIRRAE